MKKPAVTWVRIGGEGKDCKMVCERCLSATPLALPMAIDDVVPRLRAMELLHRNCEEQK